MRSGFATVFMHVCIEYVCVLLLVQDLEIPTNWRKYACSFINSFALLNKATEVQPAYQFSRSLGVSNLSRLSFPVGFFKAADIVSEFYLNSL